MKNIFKTLKDFVVRFILRAISKKNGFVLFYNDPLRNEIMNLIKRIKKETDLSLTDSEAYQVYMLVKNTLKVDGDLAEVGVYTGGSAKLICEAKDKKILHLFDTFEGLPEISQIDNPSQFHKGQFFASLDSVKNYLKSYPNVCFYKGYFPETADPISNKNFSFVNLDVDLYESTLKSIEFFYPRMSRGGVILSHDYIYAPGVKKAFDDFFNDKQEIIIELSGSQCMVVKL